jgi:membrane protein insertase Oxa1/YidC/SpoIIIJ
MMNNIVFGLNKWKRQRERHREMKYTASENVLHALLILFLLAITIPWFMFLWFIVKNTWPILLAFVFTYGIVKIIKTKRKI